LKLSRLDEARLKKPVRETDRSSLIGGGFRFKAIRKVGTKLFRISALEMGSSALLAGLGTFWMGASPLEAGFLAVMSPLRRPRPVQERQP
jgi:hypothetical protein